MKIETWFIAPMIFCWICFNYLLMEYANNVNNFYPITTIIIVFFAVVFTKLTFMEEKN